MKKTKSKSATVDNIGREIRVGDIVTDDTFYSLTSDQMPGRVGRVIAMHDGVVLFRVFDRKQPFTKGIGSHQCLLLLEDKNPTPVETKSPSRKIANTTKV